MGSVGVWFRGGGGDVVQGLDVGDFEVFDVDFGCRGEGADEAAWVGGLQGLDGGVDGGEVGGWRARVRGPVEEDYAGGVGVGEEGVLLDFAGMRCGFAGFLMVGFAGGSSLRSTGDHFELGL